MELWPILLSLLVEELDVSDENCFTDHLLNDFCDHTCAVPFPFTVADNVEIMSANGSGSSVNRKFVVKKGKLAKMSSQVTGGAS